MSLLPLKSLCKNDQIQALFNPKRPFHLMLIQPRPRKLYAALVPSVLCNHLEASDLGAQERMKSKIAALEAQIRETEEKQREVASKLKYGERSSLPRLLL